MKEHTKDGIVVCYITAIVCFLLIYHWLYLGWQEETIKYIQWVQTSISNIRISILKA